MANPILVQVRVDKTLRDDASDILDELGLDIPTAIRMFLKSVVRENGLPLAMKAYDTKPEKREEKEHPGFRLPSKEEILTQIMYYTLPEVGPKEILLLPPEFTGAIPTQMYVQLICKVPKGRITRTEEIDAFLKKAYGAENISRGRDLYPTYLNTGDEIPYWRVVTTRGIVKDWYPGAATGSQQEKLREEGFVVLPSGPEGVSMKVDHYKDYIYDFSDIKVVKNETPSKQKT